jgi:predicted RNA binding protein YcfA (HicA-like mRNA interferase family)
MSAWSSTKAKRVYAALTRLRWVLKKQVGSHRKLQKARMAELCILLSR